MKSEAVKLLIDASEQAHDVMVASLINFVAAVDFHDSRHGKECGPQSQPRFPTQFRGKQRKKE